MPVPDPENGPESEDFEVDPFAELGVENTPVPQNTSDGLEAFMDDDGDNVPVESVPHDVEYHEEEDDDDDLFATLGVAGPSVSLSSSGDDDILAAFMDDDEEEIEEPVAPTSESSEKPQSDAIDAYKMVLETVWVDGILDPGEVNLLAKRRDQLGLSFEEHLELVREMLG
mgnify:CR=1 FL=1|jgi:hypothetical protein